MITAILTTHNRPEYFDEQLEAVKNQTIPPKDIMLWHNLGNCNIDFLKGKVEKSALCTYNFGFFSRFIYALLAQTEYVAIFDDDTIPGKKWFENCLDCMKIHEGIMGTAGVILHGNYYHPHVKIGWASPKDKIYEVDLVGHAWFLKKQWISYLFWPVGDVEKNLPVTYLNGEDIHLSYTCQKHGGIKTFVPPHPHEDHEMWGSIKGNDYGNDSVASWKRGNHGKLRNEIVKNAVDNGWKPIYIR